MFPAYASTNPAVAQLFKNEFAQREASQQALEELARQDTARAEIGARSQLAQAQLKNAQEQQNYNNLFRMAEFKDRQQSGDEQRALLERQLNIDQKYKEGLVAKPGNRTAADQEAFNTDSETIANQLNSAYQTKLQVGQAAAKKIYDDTVAGLHFWQSPDKAKAAYDQTLSALEEKVFNDVQDIATRYYPPASFRADPFSRKFLPVKMPTGNAPSAGGNAPVPFGMSEGANQGTGEGGSPDVPFTLIGTDNTRQTFPTREALDAAVQSIQTPGVSPGVSAALPAPSATAPAVTPPVVPMTQPPGQMVRVSVKGNLVEMLSVVADEFERQLHLVPPAQREAAGKAILDQLLKSGRARLAAPQVSPEAAYQWNGF